MRIVWDQPKRQSNLAKHGLDFADLTEQFFDGAITRPAREGRWLALGRLDDELVVVIVFRPLGSQALSVISMRPASKGERRLYDNR